MSQMNFPVHFSSQLREHLRALRKARGLTQAALGQLLGVGQARIAEIENNPGVVSVDQLMKVLSALRASMLLRDDDADGAADRISGGAKSPAPPAPDITRGKKSAPRLDVRTPAGGQRRVQPSTGAGRDANPPMDVTTTPRRHIVIRPKKGSW